MYQQHRAAAAKRRRQLLLQLISIVMGGTVDVEEKVGGPDTDTRSSGWLVTLSV